MIRDGRTEITQSAARGVDFVTYGQSEPSSYLGYPMIITNTEVGVFTPGRRRIGRAASVKQARLLIRAYRRESSRESRAVGDLANRALDGTEACSSRLKETC